MKVRELIEQLQAQDPEAQVVIIDADTDWALTDMTVEAAPGFVGMGAGYSHNLGYWSELE